MSTLRTVLLVLLMILLLGVIGMTVKGQTTPLSFTTLTTDLNRPGAGANEWSYGQNIINIPTQGVNTPRLDRYWRFTWLDFQPAGGSAGVYSFTTFDAKIQESISKGQKFSFGIMQQCTSCDANLQNKTAVGGKSNLLPTWLITAMPSSYAFGNDWFPDYNSSAYLNALRNLSVAINAHILAGSFNGVRYRDVIDFIDIRGYGNYGEWTNNDFHGPIPTVASLDSMISYQLQAFNTFQCVIMIGAFDGGQLPNVNVPAAVGFYAINASNSVGRMGWRRDNWGWTDSYISSYLENNNTSFGGITFKDSIMARYKYAPIVGEPADCENNFEQFLAQVQLYHGSSFGNGNFNCAVNATIQNNFRAASKAAGYRLILASSGATITTSPTAGGAFQIVLPWQNLGYAPTYENWNVVFKLLSGTTVLWTGTSSFNPRLFLPSGSATTVTDNFTLSSVPAGTGYSLTMAVQDPLSYRFPMPLFITTAQNADGSYTLATGITVTSSGAVSNAGPNQSIATTSVSLTGAASTGATSYSWRRISGPNTPSITTPATVNTTVTGLITGTYVFELDINGQTTGNFADQVQILVNAPGVQANAGSNQTVTLPTSNVLLSGASSTGATTYAWTNISGPNTPTLVTPTTTTTSATGLIAGTYIFQLSINAGASTSQTTVKVLAAPAGIANAGSDQTITAPGTTSVTLSGAGSSGTLTSYSWTFTGGPSTPTIVTPTTVTTSVTGLTTIGTYTFLLTVNGGSTSTTHVIVNPPPGPASPGVNVFTTQVTANGTWNDGPQSGITGIETGMKFRSTQAGYITGMRFLKTNGNTGTHVGQLYNSAGTLLASATFGPETVSGWQSVSFSSAVAITANTTYVIAYFSPLGNYANDEGYFTTAVTNSPLVGLASGTDGPNAVYKYTATAAFPNSYYSDHKSNYWVDVIFSPVAPGRGTRRRTGNTFYINAP